MVMDNILQLDSVKCTACYACVKSCPVKAIYISRDSLTPKIDNDRCISCGSCMMACSYGAINPVSDVEQIEQLLLQGNVAAICDPSIAGEFKDISDYRRFVNMIRNLGFKYVMEVSFGVDVIANKQKSILAAHQGKHYITSHCPVMTLYTQKYQPELSSNLTPLVSPFAAMACITRKKIDKDLKIVCITPCLAAKRINQQFKGLAHIDYFLSFKSLRRMFALHNIKESNMEFSDFDEPFGNLGSLYPIAQGFVEACNQDTSIMQGTFITAEGCKDAIDAVNQFAKDGKTLNSHLNVYFCEGCFLAPGCTKGDKFIRNAFTKEYALKRTIGLDKKKWQSNIDNWSNQSEIFHIYNPSSQRLPTPTDEQIEEGFRKLGKQGAARSTNCKSCGYDTCLDLAIAIAQGIATENLCFLHATQDNTNYSNQLKLTTENLVTIQKQNEELKNSLAQTKQMEAEAVQTIQSITNHIYPAMALVDNNMKILQSNEPFIDILGEEAKEINEIIPGLKGADITTLLPKDISQQVEYVLKNKEDIMNKDLPLEKDRFVNVSIFTLVSNKQVGIIIRNLFKGEDRPEEIISRLNEVIKANLLDVQQIGFVLGEGAARTEKMLNSIIRSYKEQIGKKKD